MGCSQYIPGQIEGLSRLCPPPIPRPGRLRGALQTLAFRRRERPFGRGPEIENVLPVGEDQGRINGVQRGP